MIKSLFNRVYSFKVEEKLFVNPFIGFQISSLSNYSGVNEIKREIPIIVSLYASNPNNKDLQITIYSLINQNLKPDRIILYIDEDFGSVVDLPYSLTQFVKNGLEIKFVKSFNCYTKTIYPIKEFSNSIIVTAQSGCYYNFDWLKKLYHSYISYPKDIHVHQAKKVLTDKDGCILSSKFWEINNDEDALFNNFLVGSSGILYPPNCFTKEVLRDDIYLKSSPLDDELWFWLMALVHNRKIRVVKNHNKMVSVINIFDLFKSKKEKYEYYSNLDNQLENLMKFYGQNILNKLS